MIHLSRSLLKTDPAQTKSGASHTGSCLVWTKKAHLNLRPCSKLCAPEGGKPSLSPGGSNMSKSGTGFWNSISNSALVHEMSTQTLSFFGMQYPEMCPGSGIAFQNLSWCWLVQLPHICVPALSTSFKCGWWHRGDFGVIQLYYKHQPISKVEEKIHGYSKALKWILLKRKHLMTCDYRPPWWSWFIQDFKKKSQTELMETRWHCGFTAVGCWHLAYKQVQHWKELILPKLGGLKYIYFFPVLSGDCGKEPKPSPKSKCSYRGLLGK